jgi:hypothetical protein
LAWGRGHNGERREVNNKKSRIEEVKEQ